jgi:flavin-dependent dehydrogenase
MSEGEFDTIVVGARCAGAPLATLLARGGQKVLLLDADRLPCDQPMSTHYIHALGVDWLDELGVGARVRELSPPSRAVRMQLRGSVAQVRYPRGRAAHCIRRSVLDAILQEAAVAAGATLRDQCEVVGLLRDGERVCGVEAQHGGKVERLRARVVVGADGRNSTVARLAGAKEYLGYDNPRFAYWGYWPAPAAWQSDPLLAPIDAYIGFGANRYQMFVFQADAGLLVLGVAPLVSEGEAWRGNFEAAYLDALRADPVTARLALGNQREGKLLGLKKARYFFREAAGPGFALVGDAGLHKDPVAGIGITDALRDARNLARAILEGGDAALRRYHRQRDVDSIDLFHFAKEMGEPEYLNPLNEIVFREMGRSSALAEKLGESADRTISPFDVVSPGMAMRWTLGALLRGRFGVLPAFIATARRSAAREALRRERVALRDAG